jgi:NitT/TauT family transport system substrate-binding protein
MKDMKVGRRLVLAAGLTSVLVLTACGKKTEDTAAAPAATATPAAKTYNIGWTIYAGWMPWQYAAQNGIVKKWADKEGITINMIQINDYVESQNQFTAGKLDGVASTNMDSLTLPASGGRDTTALIVGDYSNGNDGLILKGKSKLSDVKGQNVNIVQGSVSQYFLARALESAGMKVSDVKLVNTSDADMVAAWATPQVTAVTTWNPMLQEIAKGKDAHMVYSSAKIPGEILDMMVVDTAKLKADPALGKALVGIWYETLGLMQGSGADAVAARTAMAKGSGTDLPGYEAQLATTYLYYKPADAVAYVNSPAALTASEKVRQFSFSAGLFGQGAKSVDDVGIEFPGGKIQGNPANVKMRYDPSYMQMAVDGKL